MLRRADAKAPPAAPRLAPRPPATRAHSPRMISARTTIGIVISIFRATGQGDGEPCARHGNADYGTPFHGPCMGGEWKKAEIGAPKRHYPQEKRADIHHRHRCRQGNRQHKFHKPGANPHSGLVQLRAQSNGFVVTHPFAAPFIVLS